MLQELEYARSFHSDLYKDVHGIRPRYTDGWTVFDFDRAIESLQKKLVQQMAEEKQRQQEAIAELESGINKLIQMGAKDRTTALRWLHDSNETNGDDEYLCYKLNLPYGYFSERSNEVVSAT